MKIQSAALATAITLALTGCSASTPVSVAPASAQASQSPAQKRAEAIAILRDLISDADPEAEDTAQLLHKLAFLLEDEGRLAFLDNQTSSHVAAYQQEALGIYKSINDSHEEYERIDDVLFAIYSLEVAMGRSDKGLDSLKTLLERRPGSPMAPHALLAFGEDYFNNNNLTQAMRFYEAVIEKGQTSVTEYARYKLAWCHYNLGDFERTLALFAIVAKAAGEDTGNVHDVRLAREASKDAVMAYSHRDNHDDALDTFTDLTGDKKQARESVRRLAKLLADQGRYGDANKVLDALLKAATAPSERLGILTQIAVNAGFIGQTTLVLRHALDALQLAAESHQGVAWDKAHEAALRDLEPLLKRIVAELRHRPTCTLEDGSSCLERALEAYGEHFGSKKTR